MSPLLLLQLPLLLLLLVLFLLLLHCYCYLLVATTATPTVTVMTSTADYRYQKGLEHHSGSFLHGRSFSASAINVVSYCRDNQGHTSWLLAVSNIASLLHSSWTLKSGSWHLQMWNGLPWQSGSAPPSAPTLANPYHWSSSLTSANPSNQCWNQFSRTPLDMAPKGCLNRCELESIRAAESQRDGTQCDQSHEGTNLPWNCQRPGAILRNCRNLYGLSPPAFWLPSGLHGHSGNQSNKTKRKTRWGENHKELAAPNFLLGKKLLT